MHKINRQAKAQQMQEYINGWQQSNFTQEE